MSGVSIGPGWDLTRCGPLPRFPSPLETSPNTEGNSTTVCSGEPSDSPERGCSVFQNTSYHTYQLFDLGQFM